MDLVPSQVYFVNETGCETADFRRVSDPKNDQYQRNQMLTKEFKVTGPHRPFLRLSFLPFEL